MSLQDFNTPTVYVSTCDHPSQSPGIVFSFCSTFTHIQFMCSGPQVLVWNRLTETGAYASESTKATRITPSSCQRLLVPTALPDCACSVLWYLAHFLSLANLHFLALYVNGIMAAYSPCSFPPYSYVERHCVAVCWQSLPVIAELFFITDLSCHLSRCLLMDTWIPSNPGQLQIKPLKCS